MRLVVRVLGLTVIDVEASTEDTNAEEYDSGVTASTAIGFSASAGDQAWEPGVER